MSSTNNDEAVELAELFKKHGYLDKLKNEIITKHINDPNDETKTMTLEEAVKQEVKRVVHNMVKEDETLIFKNRGTTTALIETQISKDNYQLLHNDTSGIDIHNFVKDSIQHEESSNSIMEHLKELMENKDAKN